MKYYMVLPQYDNKPKNNKIKDGQIYIANELYTENEVIKQGLNRNYLVPVQVSKNNIYWMFGARFEMI